MRKENPRQTHCRGFFILLNSLRQNLKGLRPLNVRNALMYSLAVTDGSTRVGNAKNDTVFLSSDEPTHSGCSYA